jgi:hypothetical protein
MDKADYQESWLEPVPPYGKPPVDLCMSPEHGKAVWGFLTRKRDPAHEIIVLQDDGDRRALSIGLAICDMLRLQRSATLYKLGDEDWKAMQEDKPPNRHIYEVVKSSRSLVV